MNARFTIDGPETEQLPVADLGGVGGMHPPHQPKHNVHMSNT